MLSDPRISRAARALGVWAGVVVAIYSLVMALSSIAINHRHALGLGDFYISRASMPIAYRPAIVSVPADVWLADLRSGLVSGRVGTPVLDVMVALALISVVCGILVNGDGHFRFRPRAAQREGHGAYRSPSGKRQYPLPVISGNKRTNAKVLMFRSKR